MHCDVVLRNAASRPSTTFSSGAWTVGAAKVVRTPKRPSNTGETGPPAPLCVRRSEEPRVGKECRSRCSPYHSKKKKKVQHTLTAHTKQTACVTHVRAPGLLC